MCCICVASARLRLLFTQINSSKIMHLLCGIADHAHKVIHEPLTVAGDVQTNRSRHGMQRDDST